jgi:predicted P-loop ATPase/GTPase
VGFLARRRKRRERLADVEAELDRARDELLELIRQESAERAAEIQRVMARERADSLSRLQEEERRIADERRRVVVEQEQKAVEELRAGLAETKQGVADRLASWSADLERTKQSLTSELAKLRERQQVLVAEAETRIDTDREKIDEVGDYQAQAFAKLREELQHAAEAASASVRAELEAHAAEGRRAAEEMQQRLKARDRRLLERIEREEVDVAKRIHGRFNDVERRQLETLERHTNQAATRFAEAAALQFDTAVKNAREDAARRLARELDRAVHIFAREAESVLAERLAQVADSGTQRVEKRLAQVTAGLERQRDEFVSSLQKRLAQLELELRERMRGLASEAEAERAALDRRLQELSRRADDTLSARH